MTRKIRRAAAIGAAGLVLQLVAALHWTPATFILSAALGAPLVILGGVLFFAAVWGNLKDKGAL